MRISDWSSDVCSSDLTLERADAARAHRLDVVRAHGAVSKAGRDDRTGVGEDARCAAHVARPGHARPLHPRLPGAAGHLARRRLGGGDNLRNGVVLVGAGCGIQLRGTATALTI